MNLMSAPAEDSDFAVIGRESFKLDDFVARSLDVIIASMAISFCCR